MDFRFLSSVLGYVTALGERLRGDILPGSCAKLMELINVKITRLEQSTYFTFAPTMVLPPHHIITTVR